MGTGKGQTRRAQSVVLVAPPNVVHSDRSAAAEAERVALQYKKWEEFIATSGVGFIKVRRYYMGKDFDRSMAREDYEKVLTEQFADAVQVGALVLPGNYKAEDFRFEVGMVERYIGHAKIFLKNSSEVHGDFAFNSNAFDDNVLLSDPLTAGSLINIMGGANQLFLTMKGRELGIS